MHFKILSSCMSGYVTIQIEGYFIERFINSCNQSHLFLWNLKRKSATMVRANISIQDFKNLKHIAKKTKCRIKIEKRKGFPFLLHRYQKRKIFFLFFLIIVIVIISLSNFIWKIEITGNEKITAEDIMQTLEENDFKIGKSKIGLNTKEIIDNMRLQRDDIAWIGIEIQGTNAIVQVVEADEKPDIIPEEEYCNLIATKDGMIVKVTAQNGTPVVKEGDIVTKGSVLVGGWLEGKYTGTRYVHANGEVQAKVWYSEKVTIPLKQVKKELTGEEQNKYSVKINNFEINLSKRVSKFENYDTIETTNQLKLFSNFYLPIEIHQTTYQEYQNQEIIYTVEEAKNLGIEEAKKKLEEQIENLDNVVDEKIYTNQTEDKVEVEVVYEVLENIATKEKIVF